MNVPSTRGMRVMDVDRNTIPLYASVRLFILSDDEAFVKKDRKNGIIKRKLRFNGIFVEEILKERAIGPSFVKTWFTDIFHTVHKRNLA